jgi:hypothetical protein
VSVGTAGLMRYYLGVVPGSTTEIEEQPKRE